MLGFQVSHHHIYENRAKKKTRIIKIKEITYKNDIKYKIQLNSAWLNVPVMFERMVDISLCNNSLGHMSKNKT